MREWVTLNGRLMPADEARISVFDSGLMQGIGLFETMRAYNGRILRLERHLERLINSANKLGWCNPPEIGGLRDSIEQVLAATEQTEARVRLTVTTGTLRSNECDLPELTVIAAASPGVQYPADFYRKGVTALISNYRQGHADPTVGHKTTSYFARLASLREAHAKGAFEALWFTYDNRLAEGAISSVFLVRGRELLTPPLDTPVLPGITREVVLEIAADLRITARQQMLMLDDLLSADEVFLTNSLMELMPVVRVEREPIGSEKPGEITARIFEAYGDLVEKECGSG